MLHCCIFRMIRDVLPGLITYIIFNYSISYYQCLKIIDLLLHTGVIEAPAHQSFHRAHTLLSGKK